MKKILLYRFLLIILLASAFSCTTPYNYQSNGFEDIIVIEATITNENKYQEIKLSRTYTLEESSQKFETEAVVYVTDNTGNKYEFDEGEESYISINKFQASHDREYQLHILTKDGKSYLSRTEKLTTQNPIENLQARAVNKEGVTGVEITVNSFDPTNTSKYYRYEYEETYKVIAPLWSPEKAVAVFFSPGSNPKGKIIIEERTTEARVCYLNEVSTDLILTNTNKLSEDKVIDFPVRFISSKNPIIRNRYSILVKQYVQSLAAHTFYETLKKISSDGSILSQTQPGFFYGNIKSVDNPREKVIGFFDVSSYSEKRLFFNFSDILPDIQRPNYQYECPAIDPENPVNPFLYNYCFSPTPSCQGNLILDFIQNRDMVLVSYIGTKYTLFPIECGDCTSFSSNIKPTFWID
ncbi:DUF4249 domain-containing protein [Flavobacterium sp. W1B]|uniref:DUF4249 domain-containing protein n=1 Tax=Flavobacterium sp. W1B TaxID=3394146 RepID=UPI0039BD88DA